MTPKQRVEEIALKRELEMAERQIVETEEVARAASQRLFLARSRRDVLAFRLRELLTQGKQ